MTAPITMILPLVMRYYDRDVQLAEVFCWRTKTMRLVSTCVLWLVRRNNRLGSAPLLELSAQTCKAKSISGFCPYTPCPNTGPTPGSGEFHRETSAPPPTFCNNQ